MSLFYEANVKLGERQIKKAHLSMCFRDDPYGIRTRVTAVKGRCLNHLTKGPD